MQQCSRRMGEYTVPQEGISTTALFLIFLLEEGLLGFSEFFLLFLLFSDPGRFQLASLHGTIAVNTGYQWSLQLTFFPSPN